MQTALGRKGACVRREREMYKESFGAIQHCQFGGKTLS